MVSLNYLGEMFALHTAQAQQLNEGSHACYEPSSRCNLHEPPKGVLGPRVLGGSRVGEHGRPGDWSDTPHRTAAYLVTTNYTWDQRQQPQAALKMYGPNC